MQTQLYFTDEESLKTHEAWSRVLKNINKEGSQYALSQFIKEVFFFVVKNDEKIEEFINILKTK